MGGTVQEPVRPLDAAADRLLSAFEAEMLSRLSGEEAEEVPALEEFETGRRILSSPQALRAAVARLAFREARRFRIDADIWSPKEERFRDDALPQLAYRLLDDEAAFSLEDFGLFADQVMTSGNPRLFERQHLILAAICRRVEREGADIVFLARMERHQGFGLSGRSTGRPTLNETIRLLQQHVENGHLIDDRPPTAGMIAPDEYDAADEAALAEAIAVLRPPYDAYVREFEEPLIGDPWRSFRLDELPSGEFMLEVNDQGRRALLHIAVEDFGRAAEGRMADSENNWREWTVRFRVREKLINHVLDGGLDLPTWDILKLLPLADSLFSAAFTMIDGFYAMVERHLAANPPTEKMIEMLKFLRLRHVGHGSNEKRILAARLTKILAPWFTPGFIEETAWGRSVVQWMDGLDEDSRQAWTDLLTHMQTSADKAKPAKKWLKEAGALIEAVGRDVFAKRLLSWLDEFVPDPAEPDPNADMLKGMIWAAAPTGSEKLAVAIGRFCETCYKKVPGWGARSMKLGNACLYALGQMGERGVAELVRVRGRMKYVQARQQLEKALNAAAERAGLSVADLEEIALPDFGLGPNGMLTETLGDATAEIRIEGSDEVTLNWTGGDGKPRKSVPAPVKENHKDELKALRARVKEIKGLLSGQRYRLESLYLRDRSWPLDQWRERYLEHPLLAGMVCRLIWNFGDVAAIPAGEGLVDVGGQPFEPAAGATVSLWHPIGRPAEDVLAWRRRLAAMEVTQPFKQAHREIYVLTEAELETGNYSNRFAAHVLRQHQFSALCQARGWRYTLQGDWDSHNVPERQLAGRNLGVQFWVDPAAMEEQTGSGIYQFVTTDRVVFHDGAGGTLDLADVPPLLFSELMRDVDLFVGVASIGNDPEWQDRGPGGAFIDYWQRYGFGELAESAKTRRVVLEEILPRLKIADVCEMEERFLKVRGSKRTYRIHLGSGNIQMEPNNQYLCIVPGSRATGSERVRLPFEGDGMLSIILSKAFLLAADDKITDRTILSQIGR